MRGEEVVNIRKTKLNLVDLAGSERQKVTHTEGTLLKEASSINFSLMCLGKVIRALVDVSNRRSLHICYRNSKLTFLLRVRGADDSSQVELNNAAAEMDCFILLLSSLTICAGFEVIAPADRVLVIRGQPAILGCQFTPDSNLTSRLCFYYQKHQFDFQSPYYRNRTTLFVSELHKGNATLRIEPVEPRDTGGYQCIVSNTKGTDKASMRLEYGAFYTEPRLSISRSGSTIKLLYEAEGFPKPEVKWFGENGEVLSDHTQFSEESSYVSLSPSLNVTFTLKNQLLNQNLLRPVSIVYGEESCHGESNTTALVVVCVLCALLLLFIIALLIKIKRMRWHGPNENGNGTLTHLHY
ncbi:hypothetical protein HF521_009687 [Silurus meridionalis]|uniref:Kinesin-like protein n=1 Tax=Silurus meridionalis TaxID=175797 RepID=A0A8T0BV99_SILME|nr:hypothetical protein HF521_009687 [Silurus meridionalis]